MGFRCFGVLVWTWRARLLIFLGSGALHVRCRGKREDARRRAQCSSERPRRSARGQEGAKGSCQPAGQPTTGLSWGEEKRSNRRAAKLPLVQFYGQAELGRFAGDDDSKPGGPIKHRREHKGSTTRPRRSLLSAGPMARAGWLAGAARRAPRHTHSSCFFVRALRFSGQGVGLSTACCARREDWW